MISSVVFFVDEDEDDEIDCNRNVSLTRKIIRDFSNPLSMPQKEFINNFRLNKDAFEYILNEVRDKFPLRIQTSAIPPILKVAAALRFFAAGSYQRSVGNDLYLGLAQATVSIVLKEFLDIMEDHVCAKWIRGTMTQEEKREAKLYFFQKTGFPGVIGCIDGTHVGIVPPKKEHQHIYRNRKGFFSLNAMIVCDHNMIIRSVDARYGGATHDSLIWNLSRIRRRLEESTENDVNSWYLEKRQSEVNKRERIVIPKQTLGTQNDTVTLKTTELTERSQKLRKPSADQPENSEPITETKLDSTKVLRPLFPINANASTTGATKTENSTSDVAINYLILSTSARIQILLFGGIDPFNPTSTDQQGKNVLQYNIRANNWTSVANMPGSRHHHSAIFHAGKIFIIGGTRPGYENILPTLSESVWSFDPGTLQWRTERDLPHPRRDFGLVSTEKGIFVIGGEDNNRKFLASTLLLTNEDHAEWVSVDSLRIARTGLAAALFKDEILVAGGIVTVPSSHVTSSVESYNFETGHWTEISNLRKPRSFGKLCVLSNFSVYIVGGVAIEGNRFISLSSIDRYDPGTKQWRKETNMSFARHGHDVVGLDDKMLIVGGVSTGKNMTLSSVECYSATIARWISGVRSLPSALSGMAAVIYSK